MFNDILHNQLYWYPSEGKLGLARGNRLPVRLLFVCFQPICKVSLSTVEDVHRAVEAAWVRDSATP